MTVESFPVERALLAQAWRCRRRLQFTSRLPSFGARSSHSMEDRNKVYKELGLFSLKKKIEDIVVRAETITPTALELEQARQIKQEEMVRRYNLWDDPDKSSEILLGLGDSNDAVKELKYKVLCYTNS